MLSSNEGDVIGKVSTIISDLRTLKGGVLLYISDPSEDHSVMPAMNTNNLDLIVAYEDNPEKYTSKEYSFYVTPGIGWVGYDTGAKSKALGEKLAWRNSSIGLYGSPQLDTPPLSTDKSNLYTSEDRVVWMPVTLPPVPQDNAQEEKATP
ncbi:MAG: hypothetical protein LBT65_03455 [Synergistaceae bacterium]|nr:hypothetical protein [Synergistaceae bacterium]